MMSALASQFPGWSFSSGGGLSGVLTISTYAATADASGGGGAISLSYAPGSGDPLLANRHWIQAVFTSDPAPGATSPYIDPYVPDEPPGTPILPFYWTTAQESSEKMGGSYSFSDHSERGYPTPPPIAVSGVSWGGELILASWDGTLDGAGHGSVTLYDGIDRGWYIEQYPRSSSQGSTPPSGDKSFTNQVFGATLTAVPEPGSWALLTIGLISIRTAARMRRRRKAVKP
jgi:hypothetical protein